MGYRIDYSGGTATKSKVIYQRKRKWWIPFCLTVLIVGGLMAWPEARQIVHRVIVPGEDQVTEQAVQGLVEDLREGTPIQQAVEVFCQEIIYHDG